MKIKTFKDDYKESWDEIEESIPNIKEIRLTDNFIHFAVSKNYFYTFTPPNKLNNDTFLDYLEPILSLNKSIAVIALFEDDSLKETLE